MLFATVLGLLLGAAAVLLVEQWLRAELTELRAAPRPVRPRISRASGALAPPPRRTPLRSARSPRGPQPRAARVTGGAPLDWRA